MQCRSQIHNQYIPRNIDALLIDSKINGTCIYQSLYTISMSVGVVVGMATVSFVGWYAMHFVYS